ncbi:MAG: ABC transporter permease [Bacillota bacterium]
MKEEYIRKIGEAYQRYGVSETIKDADIKEYTRQISSPFLMMVTTVMLISIFIIYTSFKVIAYERIPMIGTFRSVGATKRMVNMVFLSESLLYGILGGALGCLLGIGFLSVMAKMMTPNWMAGLETRVVFTPFQVLSSFFMAVALSFGSAYFPIRKATKIPI